MSDSWIPISILISFTVLIGINLILNSRNKHQVQITIRQILDKGGDLTPELLNKLGTFKSARTLDLRRSLVLLGIGIACLIAGFIINEPQLSMAIGIFPILIGVALFISWKINQYED